MDERFFLVPSLDLQELQPEAHHLNLCNQGHISSYVTPTISARLRGKHAIKVVNLDHLGDRVCLGFAQ
jgi:hypothetical protein